MPILNRLSRLFKADVHAVLDALEDPRVVLQQAIRDMQEVLDADVDQIEALDSERRRLAMQADDLRDANAKLSDELDVCFETGADELARTLLKRRLQHEALRTACTARLAELDDALRSARAEVTERQQRLDAMQQKAAILAGTTTPEEPGLFGTSGDTPHITDADVEIAFLREKQLRGAA
ncbi:MAG: PspA/IM30 family protein [Pseudomonadota bacterium]